MALKSLGLDGPSLPHDWVRSSMDGLLHSLRTDFADFLEHDYVTEDGHYISWSHAFFHHSLGEPADRNMYLRRIARFRSLRQENPLPCTLLFVRAANATSELEGLASLYSLLTDQFGSDARLLVLLDHQPSELPLLFERQPGLMLHTLSEHQCTDENYSIEQAPFVAAYHAPILKAMAWAQSNEPPNEHVLLHTVDELAGPPETFSPLPRALLRNVSLCEDLTEPFCFDPQMPPEPLMEQAVLASSASLLPRIREMVEQHFVALVRLRLPGTVLARGEPPLASARAALEAAGRGVGSDGGPLRSVADKFLQEVSLHGLSHIKATWASFWEREILSLVSPSHEACETRTTGAKPSVAPHDLTVAASVRSSRRWCPEDGCVYSLEELLRTCAGYFTEAEVRAYWESECLPVGRCETMAC